MRTKAGLYVEGVLYMVLSYLGTLIVAAVFLVWVAPNWELGSVERAAAASAAVLVYLIFEPAVLACMTREKLELEERCIVVETQRNKLTTERDRARRYNLIFGSSDRMREVLKAAATDYMAAVTTAGMAARGQLEPERRLDSLATIGVSLSAAREKHDEAVGMLHHYEELRTLAVEEGVVDVPAVEYFMGEHTPDTEKLKTAPYS